MKAKINNGQLEYFKQPAWLLGDATAYATEQGYKEVVYSEYPNIQPNEYTDVYYSETNTEIIVNYIVLINQNYAVPQPTLEERVTMVEQVQTEVITALNDKGIVS